jgi:hypothetical protein
VGTFFLVGGIFVIVPYPLRLKKTKRRRSCFSPDRERRRLVGCGCEMVFTVFLGVRLSAGTCVGKRAWRLGAGGLSRGCQPIYPVRAQHWGWSDFRGTRGTVPFLLGQKLGQSPGENGDSLQAADGEAANSSPLGFTRDGRAVKGLWPFGGALARGYRWWVPFDWMENRSLVDECRYV